MDEPGSDDEQLRRSTYASERAELLKRQSANSDAYDKAILTLSSGVLALSLSFIKEILPVGAIEWTGVLYASWACLTLAILVTVVSFRVSDAALNVGMDQLRRYYLERDDGALKKSSLSVWTDRLNNTSAVTFVAGVVLTVVFVSLNFSEAARMNKPSSDTSVKAVTPSEKRGQSVPQIQPMTKPAASAPASAPPQPATNVTRTTVMDRQPVPTIQRVQPAAPSAPKPSAPQPSTPTTAGPASSDKK